MLVFKSQSISAEFTGPDGKPASRRIEIRTSPITGRTCRIAFSRSEEREPGTDSLPSPPPEALDVQNCPFCQPQVAERTPGLHPGLKVAERMRTADSILFPNLFPYGSYSAVSLFDDQHFVEIGSASARSYADSLINCSRYLAAVLDHDPEAIYMAVTQNHLPSAGGSLLHPHLQVNADRHPSNHQRFLRQNAAEFYDRTGSYLFSEYLKQELQDGSRYLGRSGPWEWLAAFAPEGFFEIWGILPRTSSMRAVAPDQWLALAEGIVRVQQFYRSINRNGYNLGMISIEAPDSRLELRVVMLVRPNYAPWVRSDHTGFEIMLGDMTTFVSPEQTAGWARPFFGNG